MVDTRTPVKDETLGKRASSALGWSFVNTAVSRLGTLGIGIVLARLLGPAEFGTFAVALVALLAVLSFNELGISLAIVRWRTDPVHIAATVNTISVISSVMLCVGVYFAAPGFAAAMGDSSATDVVRLLGLSIVVNGAVAAPAALLQRGFQQRRRMVIDQVNVWLGALLSVGLAIGGMGAMSLAVGRLAGSVAAAVLFIAYSPIPYRFGFQRSQFRPLMRFGLPLAGASVVVFAVGYADQLVAGQMLGATALGYYVLAFNLASWPVSMFSQPLRSVAPAMFARLQHDPPAMRKGLLSVAGLLAIITLPLCLLIAGAAKPLVAFVYGSEWAPAASILVWLAVMAAFRIFFELVYDYIVIAGRSGDILTTQLIWLMCLVPALVLGGHIGGTAGIAGGQVAVAAFVVIPMYLHLLHRVGVRSRDLGRQIWPGALLAIVAGVATYGISVMIEQPFLALGLSGSVVATLVAVVVYRRRSQIGQLRNSAEVGV